MYGPEYDEWREQRQRNKTGEGESVLVEGKLYRAAAKSMSGGRVRLRVEPGGHLGNGYYTVSFPAEIDLSWKDAMELATGIGRAAADAFKWKTCDEREEQHTKTEAA